MSVRTMLLLACATLHEARNAYTAFLVLSLFGSMAGDDDEEYNKLTAATKKQGRDAEDDMETMFDDDSEVTM